MDVHCSTCGEPWDTVAGRRSARPSGCAFAQAVSLRSAHLLTDAISETSLLEDEANTWRGLPFGEKLSPRYRAEFKAIGYEPRRLAGAETDGSPQGVDAVRRRQRQFGKTLMHVVRCPSCEPDTRPDPEVATLKNTIEELLGDDLDAIAAEFEDRGL